MLVFNIAIGTWGVGAYASARAAMRGASFGVVGASLWYWIGMYAAVSTVYVTAAVTPKFVALAPGIWGVMAILFAVHHLLKDHYATRRTRTA